MDTEFGQLRSLLHKSTLNEEERKQLYVLLKQTHDLRSALYRDVYVPYALAHANHFETPLVDFARLEDLQYAVKVAPFAYFGYNVRNYGLKSDDIIQFVENDCIKHLRSLDVSVNSIGDEGIIAIAQSPYLSNLHTLKVSSTSGYVADAIAQSPHMSNLRMLDLSGNYIESGLFQIAQSSHLKQLSTLLVHTSELFREDVQFIAQSPHMSNLCTLHLSSNKIGDQAVVDLANSVYITKLQTLHLAGCMVENNGVIALAKSPSMAALEHLDLSDNGRIGPDGIIAIAQSPYLTRLTSLKLYYCESTIESILAVRNSPKLPNLRFIGYGDGQRFDRINGVWS